MDRDEKETLTRLSSRLATLASSSPLAGRRNVEAQYAIYCRQLMRDGKLPMIKRKYRG